MSDEVTARFLQDLKSKSSDIRAAAALDLRRYVHHASLDLSAESFLRYMNELNRRIFDLINSSEMTDKLGGIAVLDQLIDVPYEENETKIIRFAHYLRMIFQQTYSTSSGTTSLTAGLAGSTSNMTPTGTVQGGERFEKDALEYRLLQAASAALGHLARVGGTIAADIVEFQVKQSLEWLEGDRSEQRRYAAVLVLKELAENTPTLFNVHVGTFLDHIWNPIRDPKLFIREAAIAALRCCLNLISKRALRLRSQRYGQIYVEVLNSFKMTAPNSNSSAPSANNPNSSSNNANPNASNLTPQQLAAQLSTSLQQPNTNASIESIHGGLLIINELLRNTGDFMSGRFREIVELVLRYRDFAVRGEKPIDAALHHSTPAFQTIYGSHSRIIRDSVLMLLPKLAAFNKEGFVRGGYMDLSLAHLIGNLKVALNVAQSSTPVVSNTGAAIHPISREIAFLSLGELACIVRERFLLVADSNRELEQIVSLIREGLTTSISNSALAKPTSGPRKVFCPEALTCLASLSCAIGMRLLPLLSTDLVESMFLGGLSSTLVDSLSLLMRFLPIPPPGQVVPVQQSGTKSVAYLLASVQEKLLLCIAKILLEAANNPTSAALSPGPGFGVSGNSGSASASGGALDASRAAKERRGSSLTLAGFLSGPGRTFAASVFAPPTSSTSSTSGQPEASSPFELLLLALATLGSFPFETHRLLPLVRDLRVLDILDYHHPKLRKMAALTAAKIAAKTMGGCEMFTIGSQHFAQDKGIALSVIPGAAAAVASSGSLLNTTPLAVLNTAAVHVPASSTTSSGARSSVTAEQAPLSSALGHPSYTPSQVAFIYEILERLLLAALTDPNLEIRRAILDALNAPVTSTPSPSSSNVILALAVDDCSDVDAAFLDEEDIWISDDFTAMDGSAAGGAWDEKQSPQTAAAAAASNNSFSSKYRMDEFLLTNSTFIHELFMILNDEDFLVRKNALTILGRLALKNPGLLMPSLRKTLIQLLSEVQHGGDTRHREESSMLLGHLIHSAKALMVPYVETILKVLIPKLRGLGSSAPNNQGESDYMVNSCILEALGKLSAIGGDILTRTTIVEGVSASYDDHGNSLASSEFFEAKSKLEGKSYLTELFPILLSILSDKSSRIRKEVALRTLHQLIVATGYAVEPYFKHPLLLKILLDLLKGASNPGSGSVSGGSAAAESGALVSSSSTKSSLSSFSSLPSAMTSSSQRSGILHSQGFLIRREVMKIFGVLGALDPFLYKGILEGLELSTLAAAAGKGDSNSAGKKANDLSVLPALSTSLSQLSDDYYPTMALHALLRILRDPTLSTHHNKVIQAVMFVMKSLGPGAAGGGSKSAAKFLPLIVPTFLWVMKNPYQTTSSSSSSSNSSGSSSGGNVGTNSPGGVEHDFSLRDTLFIQLGNLISMVRTHIKPYLDGIFDLIQHTWGSSGVAATGAIVSGAGSISDGNLLASTIATSSNTTTSSTSGSTNQQTAEIWTTHILILLEKIVLALREDFKIYLPNLLPHMLRLLHTDRSFEKHITIKILHTFNVINQQYFSSAKAASANQNSSTATSGGASTSNTSTNPSSAAPSQMGTDYLYLIIPSFIRLAEHPDSNVVVKQACLASLASLARILNLHEYASRILLPLARMLDTPDLIPSAPTRGKETSNSASAAAVATSPAASLIAQSLASLTSSNPSNAKKTPSEVIFSCLHPNSLAALREDILQLLCILMFQFQTQFLHFAPLFSRILHSQGWADKNLGNGIMGKDAPVPSVALKSSLHTDALIFVQTGGPSVLPPPIQSTYLERYDLLLTKLMHFQRIFPSDLDGIRLGLKGFTGFGMTGLAGSVMQIALSFGMNVTAMGGPGVVAGLGGSLGLSTSGGKDSATVLPSGALVLGGTPGTANGGSGVNAVGTSDSDGFSDDFDNDFNATAGGGSGGAANASKDISLKKLNVSQPNLKKAWEVSQRSTKDDWIEWMRGFSIELLKESPSPALRACSILAQKYPTLARELFHAAFVSCWSELSDQYQDDLIRCLESCFHAPNLPAELLQILLNLAEFMERDGKPLPMNMRTLGALAESVHAYAKALHAAEKEFVNNPAGITESLISINNQLGNPEAATGILIYTKRTDANAELNTSWYEKLNRWEDALESYERKQLEHPQSFEYTLGRMRCLKALGEWERLHTLSENAWNRLNAHATLRGRDGSNELSLSVVSPSLSNEDEALRREVAPLGCVAAWNLARWGAMSQYLPGLDEGVESEFLRAVVHLQRGELPQSIRSIERARELLDTELVSLLGESYQRAYRVLIQVQQLEEMEEIVRGRQAQSLLGTTQGNSQAITARLGSTLSAGRSSSLSSAASNLCINSNPSCLVRQMWNKRLLNGVARNVEVWQSILLVRSIVVSPREDMDTYLKFSSLCRKNGRLALSLKVLTTLLGFNPHQLSEETRFPVEFPNVTYTYLKHLWSASGDGGLAMKTEAIKRMQQLIEDLNAYSENPIAFRSDRHNQALLAAPAAVRALPLGSPSSKSLAGITASSLGFGGFRSASPAPLPSTIPDGASESEVQFDELTSPFHLSNLTPAQLHRLKSRIYLKMGLWQLSLTTFNEASDTKSGGASAAPNGAPFSFTLIIPGNPASSKDAQEKKKSGGGGSEKQTTSSLNEESIPKILHNFQKAKDEIEKSLDYLSAIPQQQTPAATTAPTQEQKSTESHPTSTSPALIAASSSSSSSSKANKITSSDSDPVAARRLYKVWHNWAVMNFRLVQHYKQKKQELIDAHKAKYNTVAPAGVNNMATPAVPAAIPPLDSATQAEVSALDAKIIAHVIPALRGFFRSVSLAGDAQSLQDILRLLTLWFSHGWHAEVESVLNKEFEQGGLSIDTWLSVIPQIIARIDSSHQPIRRLIFQLLCKIGLKHAQALVYPLAVVSKSSSRVRKQAALEVMNFIRGHSEKLLEQSLMVSRELIRVAILWHEMWHEALEEASRLWFGQRNFQGMVATLQPLRRMMERGATTLREISFVQAFGRDFQEAFEWQDKYVSSGNDSDLNQAWDILVSIFRKINKQLTLLNELELQYVSPTLLQAHSLQLAMPGTFLADRDCPDKSLVLISYFNPTLKVIESKQRPRKLSIMGSDGLEYAFLLKGHEDLRQDKRVMQLFGLVNTLLVNDQETGTKDLKIRGYSVIPLAPNSGLIQWMSDCDTLHSLIKDYRDARKVLLNIEHRLMLQMAPDHALLTLMQKVEVFEYALARTTGQDLAKVLWLNSQTSEMWLDRRTNYTRSLAVMCMVGYILGLGDRHPCNLMLDRFSGKILHIDFGDCFEVAMQREKFPEKIPFRLTRMLVTAMEVSGIEGTFRSTANSVMRVLRDNKESVMAVLEAFVYDPLINWRLLAPNKQNMHGEEATVTAKVAPQAAGGENGDGVVKGVAAEAVATGANPITSNTTSTTQFTTAVGPDAPSDEGDSEVLNAKAVAVIGRVESKLQGRDFDKNIVLDTSEQVEKLIRQATSHTNLCLCYIGWCPFW